MLSYRGVKLNCLGTAMKNQKHKETETQKDNERKIKVLCSLRKLFNKILFADDDS